VRTALTFLLVVALAAPAYAAGPTATTAAPTTSTPQPAPGSPFSAPVQDLVGQATTETTVTHASRQQGDGSGRSTLLFLSIVALVMIGAVGVFIWYEGAKGKTSQEKRRRHRMRAGRPAASAAAMSAGSRSGPPPPPRKRGSKAKRKKR
jgi:hypothetical protein